MTGLSEEKFLCHAPCNNCGSRDNLAIYQTHSYSFGCKIYIKHDGQVLDQQPKPKTEFKQKPESKPELESKPKSKPEPELESKLEWTKKAKTISNNNGSRPEVVVMANRFSVFGGDEDEDEDEDVAENEPVLSNE